jgi:hypothetical protein
LGDPGGFGVIKSGGSRHVGHPATVATVRPRRSLGTSMYPRMLATREPGEGSASDQTARRGKRQRRAGRSQHPRMLATRQDGDVA